MNKTETINTENDMDLLQDIPALPQDATDLPLMISYLEQKISYLEQFTVDNE